MTDVEVGTLANVSCCEIIWSTPFLNLACLMSHTSFTSVLTSSARGTSSDALREEGGRESEGAKSCFQNTLHSDTV